MPRALWIGGLVLIAASMVISLVLWPPAGLFGLVGLLFAASPLIARLDAVKLDGPYLRVRKAIRWVGPVDLRTLVALSYHPGRIDGRRSGCSSSVTPAPDCGGTGA